MVRSNMSQSTQSQSQAHSATTRLKLHSSPHSAANAARSSIINSSAHGWSPLKIAKRDESPLKPSPNMSEGIGSPNGLDASPRRTSSSFKHVTKNSLVSNSTFIQSCTGSGGLTAAEERVIHERGGGKRAMGEAPVHASGVASTPKASIGLGISATSKPRSASRSASGGGASGSAVSGTRRVSAERTRVAFPAIAGTGERRASGERVVSGSKENESPDIRSGKRVPRQSMGLKGLARNEYVSKSPFRRVPSGGLSNDGAARANESPTHPSPHSFPVEKDDVFSSPSPSAGRRRSSPSTFRARNSSATPSPGRSSAPQILGSGVSPSPLGKRDSLAPASHAEASPSPTPVKSSMTPSRRLRGPRDFGGDVYDSPTKTNKTVTFQTVPDVKEFDKMSIEGATPDGSFEMDALSEGEDEEEWADENVEDSLEEILLEPESLGKAMDRQQYRVTNPDIAGADASEDGHGGIGDESATAEFMDTLIQEGLFSPPEMSSETFHDYPNIHLSDSGPAPFLSTPSLGSSVHVTPMLAGVEPDMMFAEHDGAGIPYGRSHHAERNAQAHAQPINHDRPIVQPSIHQSRTNDERILFNANAAQPATPRPTEQSKSAPMAHQDGPMPDPFITSQTAAKVLAPSSGGERVEDGVPLARTSHSDRIQAARMLATQQLGLGMPRSPAVANDDTKNPNSSFFQDSAPSPIQSSESDDVDSEMLFDASFEMSNDGDEVRQVSDVPQLQAPSRLAGLQAMVDKEEKALEDIAANRRLPKPPKVTEIKLPSPITSPTKTTALPQPEIRSVGIFLTFFGRVQADNGQTNTFDFSKGFNLPSISLASPLVVAPSSMPTALPPPSTVSESGSEIDDEEDEGESRHLTPPPSIGKQPKPDSPHRIPSFGDFGDLKFEATVDPPSPTRAPPASTPAALAPAAKAIGITTAMASSTSAPARPRSIVFNAPDRVTSSPTKPSLLGKSLDSVRASSTPPPQASGSTSTKVRQRISREMIRETIQQRRADGVLSRHSSSASGHILDAEIPKRRPVSMGKDKDLPAPPPKTPVLLGDASVPMVKAHTTEAALQHMSQERPIMRPRSKTQSAEEVIQSNVKDGFINEPKSALDKLMDGMNNVMISSSPDRVKAVFAKPISILQKPKDSTLIPPSPSHMTAPVSKATPSPQQKQKQRSPSTSTPKGKDKEKTKVPEKAAGSEVKPKKKGRRSMSTGDVGEDAITVSVLPVLIGGRMLMSKVRTNRRSAQPRLTLGFKDNESMLDAFKDETDNIGTERKYKVREKKVIGAKYDGDKVGHNKAGDIDSGASRAWRQLRRPSDMVCLSAWLLSVLC